MTGIDHIKRLLPHRYPMLLVDRVDEVVVGESITVIKAVTANEPYYEAMGGCATLDDHAYPEILLVESWCQAAGVLAAWDRPNPEVLTGNVMLFGSISGIKFHCPVHPGDLLEHNVRLVRNLTDAAVVEGETMVGSTCVMAVERVVMALRPTTTLVGSVAAPAGTPGTAVVGT